MYFFTIKAHFLIFSIICKFYEIGDLVKIKGGFQIIRDEGFPGGTVVENLPANAGDAGSCPGLGGSHMPRSN